MVQRALDFVVGFVLLAAIEGPLNDFTSLDLHVSGLESIVYDSNVVDHIFRFLFFGFSLFG